MVTFVQANWELLTTILAAIWAISTFFITRRHELSWRRTEFIIQQSAYLDNDPEMREGTLMLYGRHHSVTIEDFLEAAENMAANDEIRNEIVIKFEKYLNFIWRIAYAHLILETLTTKDLLAFGAYLRAVSNHARLSKYCLSEGYDEIVHAAEMIDALE